MIIPPYTGVWLVEFQDRIELVPVWYRDIVGLGRFKANQVGFQPGEAMYPMYNAIMGNKEIWVVVHWQRYEDGREEPDEIFYLEPNATEADARKKFDEMVNFVNMSKAELRKLASMFEASKDDLAYIESRPDGIPITYSRPDRKSSIEEQDLYQARLKVLAGLQPKTVTLMEKAYTTEEPREREKIEHEAVEAYFAEMAHYWTEDLVKEWQRSNPIGTEWMCEFARVWQEPKREIDPINHELVLNWLRRKYNLLTAEELSDAILVMTGQRVMPGTLKKRRERLGLTTKRPPGPRPNPEQEPPVEDSTPS
jgi:hypothetical protein